MGLLESLMTERRLPLGVVIVEQGNCLPENVFRPPEVVVIARRDTMRKGFLATARGYSLRCRGAVSETVLRGFVDGLQPGTVVFNEPGSGFDRLLRQLSRAPRPMIVEV